MLLWRRGRGGGGGVGKDQGSRLVTLGPKLYNVINSFWQILLYVTDDAIAKFFVTKNVSQIEGKGGTFSHMELSVDVIGQLIKAV